MFCNIFDLKESAAIWKEYLGRIEVKGGVLQLEMGTEPSDIWDGSVPPVSE